MFGSIEDHTEKIDKIPVTCGNTQNVFYRKSVWCILYVQCKILSIAFCLEKLIYFLGKILSHYEIAKSI